MTDVDVDSALVLERAGNSTVYAEAMRLALKHGVAWPVMDEWIRSYRVARWRYNESNSIEIADEMVIALKAATVATLALTEQKAAVVGALRQKSKCHPSCWDRPECTVCGSRKALKGRSMPMTGERLCEAVVCSGYYEDPQPGHLFRGEKDRQWRKLSDIDAAFIRESTDRNSDLAKRFAVSPATICDIQKRRSRA